MLQGHSIFCQQENLMSLSIIYIVIHPTLSLWSRTNLELYQLTGSYMHMKDLDCSDQSIMGRDCYIYSKAIIKWSSCRSTWLNISGSAKPFDRYKFAIISPKLITQKRGGEWSCVWNYPCSYQSQDIVHLFLFVLDISNWTKPFIQANHLVTMTKAGQAEPH